MDLCTDRTRRRLGCAENGNTSQPYFIALDTVTNGREIMAINQDSFFDSRGNQVFNDAQGGIMDLTTRPNDDTGEQ